MIQNVQLAHQFKFNTRRPFQGNPYLRVLKSPITSLPSYIDNGENNDAHNMFDKMLQPHLKSWNAKITGCCINANYGEALSLFCRIQHAGVRPDHYSLPALLKSCAALSAIELGRAFHGCVVKEGHELDVPVHKALMNMYAKCGALYDSHRLFDEMGHQDPVMWNILISGYGQSQLHMEAMGLFYSMHVCEDPKPNAITIAIILPVCARLKALKCGMSIHAYAIKGGLESQTLVGNALVSMYAKCGSIWDDAHGVFNQIVCQDIVSWNAMIAGYAENGLSKEAFGLFHQMLLADFKPNYATIVNILPLCAFLGDDCRGKEIHSYILRFGFDSEVSVCNALMTFYSRIGHMEEAEFVFRNFGSKDLVSWNTVIVGYAMNGWVFKALDLFHELLSTGVKPDSVTLISVLPVCSQLHDVKEGKKIHEYVLGHPGLCDDTAVGNALISFYAKCGELEDAFRTFGSMRKRDLISWNAMLAACVESRRWEKVVDHLHHMQREGIRPDSVTILSILRLFALLSMMVVKEVHGYSVRAGLINELTVGNAILDAYAKCGSMDYAFKTFESLSGKNVVTGNAMIAGYVSHECCQEDAEMIFNRMQDRDLTTWNLMVQVYAQSDCSDQALNLFCELQIQGMRPDVMSLMSILPVCTRLVSAHLLRQCHCYAIRACLDDVCLEGALVDAYSKCGSINNAYKLFQLSPQKDLVMFTAMIGGYAMHGMGEEALRVFSQMLEFDIKPDHVIMTAVLAACSHAGLVDEGWRHFNSMDDIHGIKPTMEHYSCMVDLLARAGRLKDAYAFITNMPVEANANVWGTLLGACKTHHEVGLGRLAANRLFEVEAGNIGNYVVMSNIYAADSRWDGVEEVRRLMKTKELKKPAGCSWIEVEMRRHIFVAADLSHPLRPAIYSTLRTLDQQIKEPMV
ncbi:putative pentatricopeptide repeat-containing protein At5g08490 [Magnolia sinica]|uniref:putative pentatricopeptide repeat-containing protein At5g08490 n=1 Tax=Magnolia sinica TaxID=86752 RepID=UPI00265AC4E7|nr:putative pentatricopeptide repeat-containing protein At5g08490 [Magnolia sinica]